MGTPFAEGERAVLVDPKGRTYLIELSPGKVFHTHTGSVAHDEVIGRCEGIRIPVSAGTSYVAVRPTLVDSVMKMPRGAQVIYPKDLAAMVLLADVHSGVRVLEAGVGSGALSMALLSAGATVLGYEIREDFARRALDNVTARFGAEALEAQRYRVEIRDVYDGISDRGIHRILLDVPEPWRVVGHAEECLDPGAILVAYLPTINQTSELRRALDRSSFGLVETLEVLHRTWHIEGRSVRPDHRMVAHTGFITHARLLGERGRRSSSGDDS